MNAKKIMGAVLVALLAAALFVGAAAAADVKDGDTVFLYQKVTGITGTWTLEGGSVQLGLSTDSSSNKYFAPTDKFVEGIYTNGTSDDAISITIKYPTAVISGVAGTPAYIVANGGDVYSDELKLTITAPAGAVTSSGWIIVDEDNVPVKKDTTNPAVLTATNIASLGEGTYSVIVTFDNTNFATGVPTNILTSGVAYTFNIVDANKLGISADVDTVLQNNGIVVTVTGKPGTPITITCDGFEINDYQTIQNAGSKDKYVIPNTGKVTLYLTALSSTGDKTITVTDGTTSEDLDVTISKGTITATIEKESYFVGDEVKITGTSTAGKELYVYIAGTNIDFKKIPISVIKVEKDGTWEAELTETNLKLKVNNQPLDAGSYTIYVSTASNAAKVSELGTYETVTLILKQPFISVTEAPGVAVIGTDYKVTGTAEATSKVAYYVFGTNKFIYNNNTVVDEGEFEIKITIDNMDAGQYFMVVQHPMYDGKFNIAANYSTTTGLLNGNIVKNPTGNALEGGDIVFNVWERQTANAAQALCDELDLQNIDDMYVKLSFVVAAQSSVINPIPSEVTKGSKLTISGSTNVGEGETVIVEMMSTAFAAVPKETVGSASFIALTTKTDKDGNWEITFDTTGLNVDEYTVTAAVGTLNSATAKVNVIEGAPTEQPTTEPTTAPTQTQPTEPTTPETPGFGALAALAGLGAVAVLLLRRE